MILKICATNGGYSRPRNLTTHVPVAASGSGKARAKSVRYHSVRKKSGVMCAACSHPNAVGEWLASVTSNSCDGEGENNRQRKKQQL